ncbi:MAG TPA: chorismate mutase [Gaiellaceae bacterium]|nr:chorismate mutase [Gaiellaceae bacterium]
MRDDPVLNQFREKITEVDRTLVETINKRLRLVEQLWRYKEQHGLSLHDPARESWMLQYLSRANRGPLSSEGLAELYALVLDLTKREAAEPVEA